MATLEEIQANFNNLKQGLATTGATDSSGKQVVAPGQYDPNTNVISSANMATTPTVTVPPPPTDTNNYSGIVNSGSTLIPPPVTEDPQKAQKDALAEYTALLGTPPSIADAYNTAYNDTGMADKQKAVNDLTAQLNAINAEANLAPSQTQENNRNTGATDAGVAPQTAGQLRVLALRSLPVQAALAAAQGKLSLATDKLNTLFKLKSDDINNQYNYKKDLLQKNYDIMTTAQKEKADAKQKEDDRAYTTLTNNLNQAQAWATTAISQGQGALASQIMALDPKSTDYQTKLGVLAGQIKAKATSTGQTVKSGGLIIDGGAIAEDQKVLDSTRGTDGYVYTPKYLELLKLWQDNKGLTQDFFKQYPPKTYLNPNDSSIPKYIKDMLKSGSTLILSQDVINSALNSGE